MATERPLRHFWNFYVSGIRGLPAGVDFGIRSESEQHEVRSFTINPIYKGT